MLKIYVLLLSFLLLIFCFFSTFLLQLIWVNGRRTFVFFLHTILGGRCKSHQLHYKCNQTIWVYILEIRTYTCAGVASGRIAKYGKITGPYFLNPPSKILSRKAVNDDDDHCLVLSTSYSENSNTYTK